MARVSTAQLSSPRDLVFPLQPKQRQLLDAVESKKYRYVFFGGAKGGGKSVGSRHVMLIRLMKYPGTTGLLLRRNYKDLNGNHIRPLMRAFPFMKNWYNKTERILAIPEIGSELFFGHCDNEEDVDQYAGQEFDNVAVEEATQFTEYQHDILRQCRRGGRAGIHRVIWYTSNPGGVSHNLMKRLFIDRKFLPERKEIPAHYHFIRATVEDNPALLQAEPDYINDLEGMADPMLRRAYRWGDWNIYPGQFFEEWREPELLVEPFFVPLDLQLYASMDYGTANPTAIGVYAIDPTNDVLFRVMEYYSPGYPEQQCETARKMIRECVFLQGRFPSVVFAPQDMQTQRRLYQEQTYNTAWDVFADGGFPLVLGNQDCHNGWWALKNMVHEKRLKVFAQGLNDNLMRTLPALQRDRNDLEDIKKPGQEDHAADELRMMALHFYSKELVSTESWEDPEVWDAGMSKPQTGKLVLDELARTFTARNLMAWRN